jgi:hypothetical protein
VGKGEKVKRSKGERVTGINRKCLTSLVGLLLISLSATAQTNSGKWASKKTVRGSGIQVSVNRSHDKLMSSQTLILQFTVTLDQGVQLINSPELDQLENWLLIGQDLSSTSLDRGRYRRFTQQVQFAPLSLGAIKMPPLTWVYQDPSSARHRSLQTDEMTIEIQSVNRAGLTAKTIAPLKTILPEQSRSSGSTVFIVILILTSGLLFVWRRSKHSQPTLTIAPEDIIKKALISLEGIEPNEDNCAVTYQSVLSVLRRFLRDQFNHDFSSLSRRQAIAKLTQLSITVSQRDFLTQFFANCDEARFSSMEQGSMDLEHMLTECLDFVRSCARETGRQR